MRNARAALALTLGLSALAMPFALAQAKPVANDSRNESPVTAAAATISFEKFKLANGLTVILHSDRSLPLVAVNVWYHVGPANEPEHRSGFAHLFVPLLFVAPIDSKVRSPGTAPTISRPRPAKTWKRCSGSRATAWAS